MQPVVSTSQTREAIAQAKRPPKEKPVGINCAGGAFLVAQENKHFHIHQPVRMMRHFLLVSSSTMKWTGNLSLCIFIPTQVQESMAS